MTPPNPPRTLSRSIRQHSGERMSDRCRPRTAVDESRPDAASGRSAEPTEVDAIRILLVEDMSLVRGALVALLAEASGIEVAGQARCDQHVLATAARLRPDVIIVDVDVPGDEGLALLGTLHERLPDCRVLILAAAARPGPVRRALDARVLGALDKDASPARLTESIRRVAGGERVIDPDLAVAAMCVAPNPLTTRELETLRLAAEGASAYEIAEKLSLSGGTVRNYLSRAVSKTGARSRIDAIRIAREATWL